MIKIKDNVRIDLLQPQMLLPVMIMDQLFSELGHVDAVITSGNDGKHKEGSKHYTGHALDFRIRHVKKHIVEIILRRATAALGQDYDVVLEHTHIHVEYDPKGVML